MFEEQTGGFLFSFTPFCTVIILQPQNKFRFHGTFSSISKPHPNRLMMPRAQWSRPQEWMSDAACVGTSLWRAGLMIQHNHRGARDTEHAKLCDYLSEGSVEQNDWPALLLVRGPSNFGAVSKQSIALRKRHRGLCTNAELIAARQFDYTPLQDKRETLRVNKNPDQCSANTAVASSGLSLSQLVSFFHT